MRSMYVRPILRHFLVSVLVLALLVWVWDPGFAMLVVSGQLVWDYVKTRDKTSLFGAAAGAFVGVALLFARFWD